MTRRSKTSLLYGPIDSVSRRRAVLPVTASLARNFTTVEAEAFRRAIRRLADACFVPMVSLILGLPGETPAHVQRTIELIRKWQDLRVVVFPIFYAPVRPDDRPFGLDNMTEAHWMLFRTAYAMNFRWIPGMFADNHRAASAPLWRRAFIQYAGRMQTLQWKLRFWRLSGRAGP